MRSHASIAAECAKSESVRGAVAQPELAARRRHFQLRRVAHEERAVDGADEHAAVVAVVEGHLRRPVEHEHRALAQLAQLAALPAHVALAQHEPLAAPPRKLRRAVGGFSAGGGAAGQQRGAAGQLGARDARRAGGGGGAAARRRRRRWVGRQRDDRRCRRGGGVRARGARGL